MKTVLLALIALFSITLSARNSSAQEAPITLIHAGQLLAEPGEAPLERQTIVVQGERIVAVRSGFATAADFPNAETTILDLSDQFVLPGMMDVHTHITGMQDHNMVVQSVTATEVEVSLHAARQARRLLTLGFTSIRDVGDSSRSGISIELRNAINAGVIPGPRLFVSGRLVAPTHGHGADTVLLPDVAEVLHEREGGCSGADQCRENVRREVARGVDLIKVVMSGGARDETSVQDAPDQFFPDEVDAIFGAARRLGRPVAVHAHSTAAINDALRNGARTIEHGTYFDDESIRLFRRNDAILVPTSAVADFGLRMMENFRTSMDPADWDRVRTISLLMRSSSGRAYRAGVKLAIGTDMGISATATPLLELQIFVDNGIPPNQAIRAATVNGAEVLGLGDELGQIRPNFLADIIATPRSPLDDIDNLAEISFVMKGGVVYRGTAAQLAALGDASTVADDGALYAPAGR